MSVTKENEAFMTLTPGWTSSTSSWRSETQRRCAEKSRYVITSFQNKQWTVYRQYFKNFPHNLIKKVSKHCHLSWFNKKLLRSQLLKLGELWLRGVWYMPNWTLCIPHKVTVTLCGIQSAAKLCANIWKVFTMPMLLNERHLCFWGGRKSTSLTSIFSLRTSMFRRLMVLH